MLELSRFYGIVVQVYYNDHPPVHFHPEIPAKSLEDFEAEIKGAERWNLGAPW